MTTTPESAAGAHSANSPRIGNLEKTALSILFLWKKFHSAMYQLYANPYTSGLQFTIFFICSTTNT